MFQLKDYQKKALDILACYMREARLCGENGAKKAYFKIKGANCEYHAINGLENVPYICLRLPTGGGKTFLAAHSVKTAARHYVHKDFPAVLWLVPTAAIKQQTVQALKNPAHPCRIALDQSFGGNIAVFDIEDFACVRPADMAGKSCVFVSTVQSFNVKNTEIRNIYADNESLEPHFADIPPETAEKLEKNGHGRAKCSFANLLNIHQPIVIVDEAHKAVTELNRETMCRLNPACIIEFTATPDEKESNVLCRISAAQLKAEEMIKLPIMLTETQTWQQSLAEACLMLNKLSQAARLENEYLRPIMLIQAENKGQQTTEEAVKKHLIEVEHILPERIAIATGEQKELEGINLLSPACHIDFIITKQALREGWDCPFAYIFCSVAKTKSLTAVEQFLGRVLRMPYAKKRKDNSLNRAYAYVSSSCWTNAVAKLKDSLTQMGFDEQESREYLKPPENSLNLSYQFTAANLDLSVFSDEEKKQLSAEQHSDGSATVYVNDSTPLVLREKIAEYLPKNERLSLFSTFSMAEHKEPSFAEKGEKFAVPQLCLFDDNAWRPVLDSEAYLPDGWKLLIIRRSFPLRNFP